MSSEASLQKETAISNTRPRIKRTHLALFVRDPFASSKWYQEILGMEETARGESWAFMSFGKKHHDIALIKADPPYQLGQIGLQHFGLEIDGDMDDLRRLYARLLEQKVNIVKTTDHKVGVGLYFTDPDGNRFEFFCELVHDDEEGKRVLHEHHAPSLPIDLKPLYAEKNEESS